MKRNLFRFFSLILCICMFAGSMASVSFAGSADIEKVEVRRRTDIILKSEKEYENAYTDVDIDAVFTHGDGTKINLYGFWNGGDEWRVRFSPTKTGKWDYIITCSDKENVSLTKSGSLLAIENKGETDIDKHGFIKVSDNNRYFVYDDGTPFYWLGDTNWQAPNYVSITDCNYPGCGCKNQFTHEVNDRLSKGFTVYQTYFDSSESDGGGQIPVTKEPSMWTKKYSLINPQTFTDKYDYMFDYLADHGMVIALGFGVHSITVNSMGKEALDRLSRYLTARYAAYPVIWITAQEITGQEQFDAWVSSAKTVDKGNGYDHPQSAHQYPLEVTDGFVKKLGKESWHDFYALQNGHGPAIPKKSTYKGYYNSKNVKPFVETEANYEDIYCGGFNGCSASRISAWKANLCGSCGFTYGVTGIWANCWSTAGSTGWLGTFSTEPWYMGLDKPGSYEMKYMADFFRYADFSALIPRFDSKDHSDFKSETKVLASTEDGKTYAAYFYNSDLSTGTLKGLNNNETYSAKWYDPLTGTFTVISDNITASDGAYKIPDKPNISDWAFIITSRTDLGECKTGPLPSLEKEADNGVDGSAELPVYGGILQSPDVSCVGGCIYDANGNLTDTASALTDGNIKTEWKPFAYESTQTILLDMKEEKQVFGLDLILGLAVFPFDFRVMGSNDKENWELLSDTGISGLRTYKYNNKNALSAELSGVYRYIKIILMGSSSKDAKKTVSELRLYADKATVLPEDTVPETDTQAFSAESAEIQVTDNNKNVLPYIIGAVCAAAAVAAVAVFAVKKTANKSKNTTNIHK